MSIVEQTASFYKTKHAPVAISASFESVRPYIQGKTLDIGAGSGTYLEQFPEGSVGLDFSEPNLEAIRHKGFEAVKADINERLPFEDETFSTVFISHVLEHVDSPLGVLREIKRILKPGGYVVLAVPTELSIVNLINEGYFNGHKGHLYGFSVSSMSRLFHFSGLDLETFIMQYPVLHRFSRKGQLVFMDKALNLLPTKVRQVVSTMYWAVGRKPVASGT